MRVAIVQPEFPFSGRPPLVPPILEYLGALTLQADPDAEVLLLDANQRAIDLEALRVDLVAVSVWTVTAPWSYRFADACRARGLRVVLGGVHPTALPGEAACHADAVVVGEAESCWGEVLRDARAGRLAPRYHGVPLPLDRIPVPMDGRLAGNYRFRGVFTMRGCPYRCTFCNVHRLFGNEARLRPIPEVVREVETRCGRVWFNGDDNIWGSDVDRTIALYEELARGSRKSWYGLGDLRSLQGPKAERLLRAARRSGLCSVWVGWESDSGETLRAYGAWGKQGQDRLAALQRLRDHGLDVVLLMVLGGRTDAYASFQQALELSDRLGLAAHPALVTPFPGTELYEAYRPHLLPGTTWDQFTGTRALFEHPDPAMTPARREAAYHQLCEELYRPGRVARRILGLPLSGFPTVHLLSLMKQVPIGRAHRTARRAWLAEQGAGRSDPAGA
ncbi:B12-binding domain-containing radical SAM protein [Anaeromyxobacter paludicola]|uniref:B12-binding domain-containing radical SAM protein n=1 Tax=Anaeromyxobacter paludicola TaxID=2918171 RepID=A0ABM7X6F6_9BACT|nr:radical SAM protein [Anaeromyxobacter paludicola]BDG07401.1 B12-binding domain-containing radical SAM protein [Anaeromyxobacter paludicola]